MLATCEWIKVFPFYIVRPIVYQITKDLHFFLSANRIPNECLLSFKQGSICVFETHFRMLLCHPTVMQFNYFVISTHSLLVIIEADLVTLPCLLLSIYTMIR